MSDSRQKENVSAYRPFEGMWLMTNPSGAVACAKTINGKLLVPYSFGNEGKLAGHYYGSLLVGQTLVGWFEQFDSDTSGGFLLTIGPNETLKGGRWIIDEIPHRDISRLSESLPGCQETVWIRMLNSPQPEWVERYFSQDWPRKYSA